jgi:hypothetical protein
MPTTVVEHTGNVCIICQKINIIEKILAYLPQYFMDFGSLFSGPRRFLAQKNTDVEDAFAQSLLFLGISVVLVVIMTAPLLPPGKDLCTYLGTKAVAALLVVSLSAVALHVAWRIVGGKATIRSFFVTYAYFIAMLIVVFTLFLLLSEGVFKVLAPDLYTQGIEAKLKKQPMPDLSGSSIPLVSFYIQVAGVLFLLVWLFIAWGAYRELNGLSEWRSSVAMLIAGLFGCAIAVVVFFVQRGMM